MKMEIITGIISQNPKSDIIWVYFMFLFVFTVIMLVLRIEEVIMLRKQLKECQEALKRKIEVLCSKDV